MLASLKHITRLVYISCTVEDSPFETAVAPRTACGATRERDHTLVRRSEEVQQVRIHRETCRAALAAYRTATVIIYFVLLSVVLSHNLPNYCTIIYTEINNIKILPAYLYLYYCYTRFFFSQSLRSLTSNWNVSTFNVVIEKHANSSLS